MDWDLSEHFDCMCGDFSHCARLCGVKDYDKQDKPLEELYFEVHSHSASIKERFRQAYYYLFKNDQLIERKWYGSNSLAPHISKLPWNSFMFYSGITFNNFSCVSDDLERFVNTLEEFAGNEGNGIEAAIKDRVIIRNEDYRYELEFQITSEFHEMSIGNAWEDDITTVIRLKKETSFFKRLWRSIKYILKGECSNPSFTLTRKDAAEIVAFIKWNIKNKNYSLELIDGK